MYSVSAAAEARRESVFLRPRPALSALPRLFPPPLPLQGGGEGGQGREEGSGGRRDEGERKQRSTATEGSIIIIIREVGRFIDR